jgi:LemA protein
MNFNTGSWIFLAVVAGLIFFVVGMYNRLVKLRQQSRAAWSDIDAQLKRRADLVGNLVETVKGYAAHEERTFTEVTSARTAVSSAREPGPSADAEHGLTQALKSLFVVAEAYPDLKADKSFLGLQAELSQLESDALNARRYYNAVVRDYNTALETFPSSLIATLGAFRAQTFFQVDQPADRRPPRVSFER